MKEREETLDTTYKRRSLRAETVTDESVGLSAPDVDVIGNGIAEERANESESLNDDDNESSSLPRQEAVSNEPPDERVREALSAASDKKAIAPVVLDLREVANFTDFFIIVSGANPRQVQAISDEVVERLKRAGTRAARVEGYNAAEWTLIDYGDFVVHIFDEKSRQFYDLERLWRDARRIDPATLGVEA